MGQINSYHNEEELKNTSKNKNILNQQSSESNKHFIYFYKNSNKSKFIRLFIYNW